MKLLALPCAGFLCKLGLQRFHVTCLWCRWRREWLGKFVFGKTVTWVLPWSEPDQPEAIQIDQRGHGLMFRCCCVIILVNITFNVWKLSQRLQGDAMKKVQKLVGAPWMNLAECVACLPFP